MIEKLLDEHVENSRHENPECSLCDQGWPSEVSEMKAIAKTEKQPSAGCMVYGRLSQHQRFSTYKGCPSHCLSSVC